MDGRRLRRWFLCGGVVVTAVGCNRGNTYHDQFGMPKPGQTVAAIDPPGASKSFWGGSKPPAQPAPPGTVTPGTSTAGKPLELAATPSKKSAPKSLMPDTEVEFANTHVEVAQADPPPPNRDELLDMARMRYQRALKQDAKHKGALLGIARMHAKLGDREKALEAYKKYLHHYPKDGEVLHELALAHARWKDFDGAVAWCQAALKLDPENRSYRKTMGFCQARGGKWEEAFGTLRQIMPEAQARYDLARVLGHQNQPEQSRQQLQLAIQADPNFAPAQEYLAALDQPAQPVEQPGMAVPGEEPNPIVQTGGTEP